MPYGKKRPVNAIEDEVAKEAERIREQIAVGAAEILGPAPGTETPENDAEAIDLWDFRDPSVDPMARYTAFVAAGLTPSQARAATAIEVWPHRLMLLDGAGPDVAERVKLARSLQIKSANRAAKRGPGPAPGAGLAALPPLTPAPEASVPAPSAAPVMPGPAVHEPLAPAPPMPGSPQPGALPAGAGLAPLQSPRGTV